MDSQVLGLIALVRAALTGKARELPADFDLEQAYDAINKHNIAVMALEGAALCGVDKKLPVMQKLFVQAFAAIARVEEQDRCAAELFAAFEAAQIDFMPVKGALLRDLYPKREYRSMGDMDILIRTEQYDRVREVMEGLGYSAGEEDDHAYVWRKGALMLELHKRLIPSYHEDYYDYFGSGWQLAQKSDANRYVMRDEDHYLFVFAHFAKHYRGGGVGIRQMCDLWLMREKMREMDADYICRELDKLNLLEFHNNIFQTLNVWLADASATEKTDHITIVIYHSGAFGQLEERMLGEGALMVGERRPSAGTRYRNVWGRMFLPIGEMGNKYPVLRKYPVLLPLMWVYRGGYILLRESWKVKRLQTRFHSLEQENLSAYQRALEYVGLKFRNK